MWGRSKLLTKKRKDFLWKFWGYLKLPITGLAIWSVQLGAAPIAMMLQAPVPCGASKRKASTNAEQLYCRKNAKGLLGGCDIIQHKWANFRLLVTWSKWGIFFQNLMTSGKGIAADVGALAATCSALFALLTIVINLAR